MTDTATTRDGAEPPGADPSAPLLEVRDLHVEFRSRTGPPVHAVNGLSYAVDRGETLAILGESGSGKSVSAQAVLGLLESPPARITGGEVRYRGLDLLGRRDRWLRRIRGRHVAMIFQDALTALNPVIPVADQIAEMYRVHERTSRSRARARAIELMERVRIPAAARRAGDYPHQFSGGMRQRVMIAMALALRPDVLIADEPTTALDVTVQAQIMRLLAETQRELDTALVLITHDLGVVADVADHIVVMYAGSVMERAPVTDLYTRPAHPYTAGLLAAVPRVDKAAAGRLTPISGVPPNLAAIPSGCPFHPRCPRARDRCATETPELREVGPGRASACHYAEEVLTGEERGDGGQ